MDLVTNTIYDDNNSSDYELKRYKRIYTEWEMRLKANEIKNDELKGKELKRINQTFIQIPLARFKNKLVERVKIIK